MDDDRDYIAILRSSRFEFKASSLYDAKKKAVAYFKPRKRDECLISVMLADVEHHPSEA
jgi:hypothetical protein